MKAVSLLRKTSEIWSCFKTNFRFRTFSDFLKGKQENGYESSASVLLKIVCCTYSAYSSKVGHVSHVLREENGVGELLTFRGNQNKKRIVNEIFLTLLHSSPYHGDSK